MKVQYHIDWSGLAGDAAAAVRPQTRDKYFPRNPLRQAIINRFLAALGDALAGTEWETILDVGCGEGFVDYYLARRFPDRAFTAADPDPGALAVARKIVPAARHLLADGRALPFPDRSHHVVLCTEVVEHLPDYPALLAELRRVASRAAVVTVPAWPWYQAAHLVSGRNWDRWGEHPDHVLPFSRDFFRRALETSVGGNIDLTFAFPWLIGACRFSAP